MNKINEIKKNILMKKILLNFLIDKYSKYDMYYRYLHILIGVFTIVVTAINQITKKSTTPSLILSTLFTMMLKIKEYLKFDKHKEISKHQALRYAQLYDTIEKEMFEMTYLSTEEFLVQLNRDFMNIQNSDPDISYRDKQNFKIYCQKNNIPFKDDTEIYINLINEDTQVSLKTYRKKYETIDINLAIAKLNEIKEM